VAPLHFLLFCFGRRLDDTDRDGWRRQIAWLGHLDGLIIVPLGIALAIRLVPPPLMAEFRARAVSAPRPKSRIAMVLILLLWLAAAWLLWRVVSGWWR